MQSGTYDVEARALRETLEALCVAKPKTSSGLLHHGEAIRHHSVTVSPWRWTTLHWPSSRR
jgi:hypothetical protein